MKRGQPFFSNTRCMGKERKNACFSLFSLQSRDSCAMIGKIILRKTVKKENIMLTSKQRAFLRGMANGIDAIFQVGKNGVTPELRDTVFNALEARELVKISVLDNNMLGAREAAEMLASRTGAEVVQVIGNKFVLYKAAKKPVIELPPAKK